MKKALAIAALLLVPILVHARSDFMAFFAWGNTELSAQALRMIAQAAKGYTDTALNGGRYAPLLVHGHTDTSEPDEESLSLGRAMAVKQALVREGVPAEAIMAVGRGTTGPLVPTGAGVREPQNRYVWIEFRQFVAPFDRESPKLSAFARQIIRDAAGAYSTATAARLRSNLHLFVNGYVDPSEQDAEELSLRRARTVREALIDEGVPAEAVTVVGRGNVEPPGP